jgi:hypothetical protein
MESFGELQSGNITMYAGSIIVPTAISETWGHADDLSHQ